MSKLQFHPAYLIFAIMITGGMIWPVDATALFSTVTQWFQDSFGWLVLLVCVFFIGFSIYLAFSRFGHLRLGGPDEQPQFSTASWLAMLFAAGMGSGLVFYGAAEPLMHYMDPPPSALKHEGLEAARYAMAVSYFHWGIHAWAIYAMAALSIAYFTFHRHTPLLPSAPITRHPMGALVIDTFAILAVVFGLVASLSQGVLQVTDGLGSQFGVDIESHTTRVMVLVVLAVCYLASSCTGIGKGIKILSDINMNIAIVLMLFILFVGPTHFIMESFVSGIGDYLDQFIHLSFDVRHYSDAGGWTESWTINYFLWWISWGPFVGVFIARISKGRTLKQFMLGVILVPTVFSAIWFATLGGTAMHLELVQLPGFGAVVETPERTTYAMLAQLPLADITPLLVILLLFIFLVTSADSGTYVLGMFTSKGALRPPVWMRLMWGVIVGLVTAGVLMTGKSTAFFKSVAVIGAIPYLFVMLWQTWGLYKALRKDVDTKP